MIFYKYCFTKDGSELDFEKRKRCSQDRFENKIRQEGIMCREYVRDNVSVLLKFYIVELTEDYMVMVSAYDGDIKELNTIDAHINDFVVHMNFDLLIASKKEITLHTFFNELEKAYDNNFISNVREIKDKYDFDFHGNWFREYVFRQSNETKENLLQECDNVVVDEVLKEEIERIYTPKQEEGFGVPVHYMLNIRDDQDNLKIIDILMKALKANGRTIRDIYSVIDLYSFNRFDRISDAQFKRVFELAKGGVVVIKSRMQLRDDDHYNIDRDLIDSVAKTIYFNSEETTVILCCVGRNQKQITAFKNELCDVPFVEISDTVLYNDQAKKYLAKLAKQCGVTNTTGLEENVEIDMAYTTLDLRRIFKKWHKHYVRTVQFPQYMNFAEQYHNKIEEEHKSANVELNNLIGLNSVKEIVNNYINYARLQKACQENGFKVQNTCRHMCFVGNPGTAKTTVARIVAKIMKENGLLSKGDLIEVGRADIVSRYVGGTAPNVQEIFKKAMGNVLFIDEAYSLYDGKQGLYGDEAINAIVQEMENRREDLVVIFAGYKKEMQNFLEQNSGLKSRIAYEVEFPDYTQEELLQIAHYHADCYDIDISKCEEKLNKIIKVGKELKNFGNGRFIRSVLEKARMKQAGRLIREDKLFGEYIKILQPEDFDVPIFNEKKFQMGFC